MGLNMRMSLTRTIREAVLSSRTFNVTTVGRTDHGVTMRVTLDFDLDREAHDAVAAVAAHHHHSVPAQVWHFVKDTLRLAHRNANRVVDGDQAAA
jgi:hypothetical protein